MKNKKYKIVIFSDLKKSLGSTLKSTLSLAKMLNGEITIFHVKKALDIVNRESQLSAIRSLNSEYIGMDNDINSIVTTFSKDFGVPLTYSCTIGNVKNELANYIDNEKPDFIVLGKRKSNLFNIVGDNIIPFVIKKYSGPIFLADEQHVLELNNELSLGILSNEEETAVAKLTEDLLAYSQKPLKSFTILKNVNTVAKTSESKKGRKEVAFVFESNDNSVKNLSNYVSINNVNLLCVNRYKNRDRNNKSMSMSPNIDDIIQNLNVPLILLGQENYTV